MARYSVRSLHASSDALNPRTAALEARLAVLQSRGNAAALFEVEDLDTGTITRVDFENDTEEVVRPAISAGVGA